MLLLKAAAIVTLALVACSCVREYTVERLDRPEGQEIAGLQWALPPPSSLSESVEPRRASTPQRLDGAGFTSMSGVTVEDDTAMFDFPALLVKYATYDFLPDAVAGAGRVDIEMSADDPPAEWPVWVGIANWDLDRWSYAGHIEPTSSGLEFSFPNLPAYAHPDDGRVVVAVITMSTEPWTLHSIGLDNAPWFSAPVPGMSVDGDFFLVDADGRPGIIANNGPEGGVSVLARDPTGAEWNAPKSGPTGLFTIYDGQTLRNGEFTFSLAYSNYDRDPEYSELTEVPVSFQLGLADYLELFFNTDAYRQPGTITGPDIEITWMGLTELGDYPALGWAANNNGINFVRADDSAGNSWPTPKRLSDASPRFVSNLIITEGDRPALAATHPDGTNWFYRAGVDWTEEWAATQFNLNGCDPHSLLLSDGNPAIIARYPSNGSVYFCLNSEPDGSGTWSFDLAAQTTHDCSGAIIDGKPALVFSRQQLIDGKYICNLMYLPALTGDGSDWGPEEEIDSYTELEAPTEPYNWSGPENLGNDGSAGVAYIRREAGLIPKRQMRFAARFRF